MKNQYHYLISGLPELRTRGRKAEHQLEALQAEISDNLASDDLVHFRYLLYRNDNKNLLSLLREHEGIPEQSRLKFHRPCAFSHQQLEEGLSGLSPLPDYMLTFLDEQRRGAKGRQMENRLKELYYDEALSLPDDFIRDYFYFKRDLKNVVIALNARRFGYELPEVLVGSYELTEQLEHNAAPDFGLAKSHPYVNELAALIDERDFLALERTLDRLLEEHLDELVAFDYFGAARVFAYFIKLSLSHRWLDVKRDAGLRELERLIDRVLHTGALPSEASEGEIHLVPEGEDAWERQSA